jgi:hypothetical protein
LAIHHKEENLSANILVLLKKPIGAEALSPVLLENRWDIVETIDPTDDHDDAGPMLVLGTRGAAEDAVITELLRHPAVLSAIVDQGDDQTAAQRLPPRRRKSPRTAPKHRRR